MLSVPTSYESENLWSKLNASVYASSRSINSNPPKKITEAQQPERFTQDFLETKLGFEGGSARPIVPFLKRVGMLASDGAPTPLYSRFRNSSERGQAAAEALKIGFKELFERNEYAHALSSDKLTNLVTETTGLEAGHQTIRAVVGSFSALNSLADHEVRAVTPSPPNKVHHAVVADPMIDGNNDNANAGINTLGMNLSYTINLNLPETKDVEVFNAIFKNLKEHLLRG